MATKTGYLQEVAERFHSYRDKRFPDPAVFSAEYRDSSEHVVFSATSKHLNILSGPDMTPMGLLASAAPHAKLHRWFASMSSSQALAISVFGNLKHHKKLGLLAGLVDENGYPSLDMLFSSG